MSEYRLYRWAFTPFGFSERPKRGRLLARFSTYAEFLESAIRRARLCGYYDENDWMYLFDWEKVHAKTEEIISTRGTRNQHPAAPDRRRTRKRKTVRAAH